MEIDDLIFSSSANLQVNLNVEESAMKTQILILTVLLAVLVFSGDALAAKPPDAGQGGGGEITTPDYGDLIILKRDDFGVPIPSSPADVTDPETGETVDGGLCWQPIAFNFDAEDDSCPLDCVVPESDPPVVEVDQYNCAIAAGCSGCTQEVDFGRMNNARAPDSVFASQLADVVINLATADCVTLDPAGRLVVTRVETVENELGELVDVVTSSAIDSPLQNLAIYKQLIKYGYLGDELSPIALPASELDTAARALGAASDKGGEVNVDKVAYLNSIMGLDDVPTILDPKLCEIYREEVQGVIQRVEKCFLDYSFHRYDRETNFSEVPNPGYIAPRGFGEGVIGWFEYLAPLDESIPTFDVGRDRIQHRVFGSDAGFEYGNIGGFAQAADDARAVINYMHSWPLPADYATPLVPTAYCVVDPDEFVYDVSISAESGLQVPQKMVDGLEGREFIVTVANASGSADSASGSISVTAIAESGEALEGSPWTFDFFDLAVGDSESWTTFFTVNLGTRTTINWKAEAVAPEDVNPSNNIQTATTSVIVTGSGSGGGGGGGGGRR